MSTSEREPEALERRAQELLRASADGLDGRLRSRLAQARSAAVEEARRSRRSRVWSTLIPAGALAGAAALALLLWSAGSQSPQNSTLAVHNSLDDLDILVTNESFELLEDLEFYEWVAATDSAGASIG